MLEKNVKLVRIKQDDCLVCKNVAQALMDKTALKTVAATAVEITKNVTTKLENVPLDALTVTPEKNVIYDVALVTMDKTALKTAAAAVVEITKNVTT
ncbi:hypothetical protein ElyMa_000797300 [Elysia marginata]|uniref:HMA domain-containing protein n=1 Tax=Elysia marginata TaxID=1093978 RepID=A0AAV4GVZ1_9GAST|nr:hypothetical protein ElyMa_000797300 [Elysia marginata]